MKDSSGAAHDGGDLAFSVRSSSYCPLLSDLVSSFFLSISCMFSGPPPEWNLQRPDNCDHHVHTESETAPIKAD